jgi:hypothetical protein
MVDVILLATAVALVLLLVGCEWLGRWLRARQEPDAGATADAERSNHFVSSVFGLLALLMGFTFSMALDRYEQRTRDVVMEANAIGGAYQRAALLGTAEGEALQAILRDYAQLRLRYGKAELHNIDALLAESARQRRQISEATLQASKPFATTPLAATVMNGGDEVGDVGVEREATMKARLPRTVFLVLVAYTCIAFGMVGYAYPAHDGGRNGTSLLLSTLFVVTLFLIVDLDRPLGGTILINQDAMRDLVAEL